MPRLMCPAGVLPGPASSEIAPRLLGMPLMVSLLPLGDSSEAKPCLRRSGEGGGSFATVCSWGQWKKKSSSFSERCCSFWQGGLCSLWEGDEMSSKATLVLDSAGKREPHVFGHMARERARKRRGCITARFCEGEKSV